MWPRHFRPTLLAAVLALASACHERGAAPQVELITTTCEGLRPLEGVTHLRLRVTGEGLSSPIERITPVDLRPEDIPSIPAGARRVLEVRAYSGEPSSAGSVLSVGRSFPFDMPEVGAPEEPVRVLLRRVNTFISVESSQQPGTCLELTESRAGHTATLLPDGRVLLAGGFRMTPQGPETLSSIEILDPQARTLTFLANPGAGGVKRAFHTASLMLDGRVALIGGEAQAAGGIASPLRTAVVFNPVTETVSPPFDLSTARTRHSAAIDVAGRVLLVGGTGTDGLVVPQPEGVEPAAQRSFAVPAPLARAGASVVPVEEGQRIAVIGGSEGTDLPREVLTFSFNGSTFAPTSTGVLLRQARKDAAAAPFDDGQRLLVMGGYATSASPDEGARVVAASELLDLKAGAPAISVGPSIVGRGELCAVSLPGGRIFTAGGRREGATGGFASSGVVELITPTENATGGVLGMPPITPARYLHTCTPLPDGSVLVAGGLDFSGADARLALGTYIFMPVPRD